MKKRHLVLVAHFGRQVSDFWTIGRHIKQRSNIAVTVCRPSQLILLRGDGSRRLVVSTQALKGNIKGTVACGRAIGKWREYVRLRDAGVPVPEAVMFEPGLKLDPDHWGEKVIVKPLFGQQGRGVRVARTEGIGKLKPEGKLMVQRFINTGDRPRSNRVAALFGKVLYSTEIVAKENGLAASNRTPEKRLAPMRPEFEEMARRCHEAIPEIPMHGVDLLTDEKTGEVYVAEINSRGFTWHMSSSYGRKTQATYGMNFYTQYGALSVAADALIARMNVLFPVEVAA